MTTPIETLGQVLYEAHERSREKTHGYRPIPWQALDSSQRVHLYKTARQLLEQPPDVVREVVRGQRAATDPEAWDVLGRFVYEAHRRVVHGIPGYHVPPWEELPLLARVNAREAAGELLANHQELLQPVRPGREFL